MVTISLVVFDPDPSTCTFPFEVILRKSVQCDIPNCDVETVGNESGAIVTEEIVTIVDKITTDTSDTGFLATLEKEGVNTTGLSVDSDIDTQNIVAESFEGIMITIIVKTDDHPTETRWSLWDVCPGGGAVAVAESDLYNDPGETYSTEIFNRKTKYLFNFIDVGGDGICCNTGADGFYEVYTNNGVQFIGGESGPFTSEAEVFGDCRGSTTSKPTNMLTASPTTASEDIDIKIMIKFDRFPEDIKWELFRYCNNVKELLEEAGPYNQTFAETQVTVYNKEGKDGFFLFRITDSYGDGLCCEHGDGEYKIEYGSTVIESQFKVMRPEDKKEEEIEFGNKSKCPTS